MHEQSLFTIKFVIFYIVEKVDISLTKKKKVTFDDEMI